MSHQSWNPSFRKPLIFDRTNQNGCMQVVKVGDVFFVHNLLKSFSDSRLKSPPSFPSVKLFLRYWIVLFTSSAFLVALPVAKVSFPKFSKYRNCHSSQENIKQHVVSFPTSEDCQETIMVLKKTIGFGEKFSLTPTKQSLLIEAFRV